jgi:hypothetical protein
MPKREVARRTSTRQRKRRRAKHQSHNEEHGGQVGPPSHWFREHAELWRGTGQSRPTSGSFVTGLWLLPIKQWPGSRCSPSPEFSDRIDVRDPKTWQIGEPRIEDYLEEATLEWLPVALTRDSQGFLVLRFHSAYSGALLSGGGGVSAGAQSRMDLPIVFRLSSSSCACSTSSSRYRPET